jgi:hypothetical protein
LKAPRPCFPEDVTKIIPNETLPDPFEFFDPALGTGGRVVTREDWRARREEIKELARYYYFGCCNQPEPKASRLGTKQVRVPETVIIDRAKVSGKSLFEVNLPEGSFTWNFADFSLRPVMDFQNESWGSWDNHKELLLTIPEHMRTDIVVRVTHQGREADIKLDALEVPVRGLDTDIKGPYPVVIVIGRLAEEQVLTLKQNGYAYISMNTGSVYSDNRQYTGAYNELFKKQAGEYKYDSGALIGWAWGVSRIIDALLNEHDYNIDDSRTAVTGCSRNGKAALLAAAFDERISVAAPCDSGATGLTGFRYFNEGRLFNYNTFNKHCELNRVLSRNEKPIHTISSDGHWLSSKAEDFLPDKHLHIPFDMHEIAALVAPRPFIAFSGENFDWINSVSSALTVKAAKEVYEFLGAGDDIALIVRDGAHANQDRDLPFIIAVMDKTFGRAAELRVRCFETLSKPETGEAIDGSGVIYPDKTYKTIAEMSSYPYELDSSYQRWSRPGKYTLWCEEELVTEGYSYDIHVHSDSPEVLMTLPEGKKIRARLNNNQAVFKLSPAQAGRYKLETAGTEKDRAEAFFQGFSLSDALRHGLNLDSTSPDGMSVGFTSRLRNSDKIEAYLCTEGETKRLKTGFIDGLTPIYLEAYGVSLKQGHIPEGPFVLNLKNLSFEALPGCIFEMYIELTGTRQPKMFDKTVMEGRAKSKQGERPSWNSSYLKNGPYKDWPVYPASIDDRGVRPDCIPVKSDFKAELTLAECGSDFVSLAFSEPVNPHEFGLGFMGVESWRLDWAEDKRSVRISFDKAADGEKRLYIFRLTDLDGNMLPSPKVFNTNLH